MVGHVRRTITAQIKGERTGTKRKRGRERDRERERERERGVEKVRWIFGTSDTNVTTEKTKPEVGVGGLERNSTQ